MNISCRLVFLNVTQRNIVFPTNFSRRLVFPNPFTRSMPLARYRNMFDMNWLHALLFSNGFGGMGGAGGAGGALPWLLFGNM